MLKKIYRLTKHGSFGFVYRKGENKASAAFSLFYVKSTSLKVGFSVSNKLGKATARNKLKRRMRAIVMHMMPLSKYQIVVVARTPAAGLTYADMQKDLKLLFARAGILNEKKEA